MHGLSGFVPQGLSAVDRVVADKQFSVKIWLLPVSRESLWQKQRRIQFALPTGWLPGCPWAAGAAGRGLGPILTSIFKVSSMKETLKNAIAVLPGEVAQGAQSMMRRMVAAMQNELAQDRVLANASYCSLLLKLSETDLVREFDLAIKEAMSSIRVGSGQTDVFAGGLSLSMTLIDDAESNAKSDFLTSTALYEKICAKAAAYQPEGLLACNKDVFLAALKASFLKARIGGTEVADLLPAARRALNAELVSLYSKLDSL